jgi:hypothetical protein
LPRSNAKFDDIAQTIDVFKFHVMHRCSLYGFVMDQLHTFVSNACVTCLCEHQMRPLFFKMENYVLDNLELLLLCLGYYIPFV